MQNLPRFADPTFHLNIPEAMLPVDEHHFLEAV
jgi:hypothetical protein